MQVEQVKNMMTENNLNDIGNLTLTIKHGEFISILNGLIKIEIDMEYYNSKRRVILRIKSPKVFGVLRKKIIGE